MSSEFPPFDEFMNLPLDERGRLADTFFERHREAINREHEKGSIQVIFCGDSEKPIYSARGFNEVLSDEKIAAIGRKRGVAVFAHNQVETVDDVASFRNPDAISFEEARNLRPSVLHRLNRQIFERHAADVILADEMGSDVQGIIVIGGKIRQSFHGLHRPPTPDYIASLGQQTGLYPRYIGVLKPGQVVP